MPFIIGQKQRKVDGAITFHILINLWAGRTHTHTYPYTFSQHLNGHDASFGFPMNHKRIAFK